MNGIEISYGEDVLVCYTPINGTSWLDEKLKIGTDERYCIKGVFNISRNEIEAGPGFVKDGFDESVIFKIGELVGDTYVISTPILSEDHALYIKKGSELDESFFVGDRFHQTMRVLFDMVKGDLTIGNGEGEISRETLKKAIDKFPSRFEDKYYHYARMSHVVQSELKLKHDYDKKYNDYLNKIKSERSNISEIDEGAELKFEIEKYENRLNRLKEMLAFPEDIKESVWQKEILDILLIIFPQYIYNEYNCYAGNWRGCKRFIDFLMVNSAGYVDVVEIKKADFELLSKSEYRNNVVPTQLMEDIVMQLENYIQCMVRNCEKLESDWTKKFHSKGLSDSINVKILNPRGIIVAGRYDETKSENNEAFELIRRQYSHMVDIMTYNDLVNRFENVIRSMTDRYESLNS